MLSVFPNMGLRPSMSPVCMPVLKGEEPSSCITGGGCEKRGGRNEYCHPFTLLPLLRLSLCPQTHPFLSTMRCYARRIRDSKEAGKETYPNSRFRINRTTDEQRQFTINDKGVLSIAKPLDREQIPNYRLRIEAEDAGLTLFSSLSFSLLLLLTPSPYSFSLLLLLTPSPSSAPCPPFLLPSSVWNREPGLVF